MKTLYIREGKDFAWEIIVADENGQVGEPIGMNDAQLLDFDCGLSKHKLTAWQRVKSQAQKSHNAEASETV